MIIGMSSGVKEDAKGKRVARKDMHRPYEAQQKRADWLYRIRGAKEMGDEEVSDCVDKQLKKAPDPKDRDAVEA
jgi:hypothetical protein